MGNTLYSGEVFEIHFNVNKLCLLNIANNKTNIVIYHFALLPNAFIFEFTNKIDKLISEVINYYKKSSKISYNDILLELENQIS